ncbi:MAG: hypothetical protein AB7S38_37360 [Vulcanimicrobiota bacterium]
MFVSRSNRGFSLAELSVYSLLLSLLLGSIYLLMHSGMRYFRLGEAYQTVQQETVVGLRKLSDELANASTNSVSYSNAPFPHVYFLSAERPQTVAGQPTHDPAGDLEWRKWVCYYHDAAGRRLMRVEEALGTPTVVPVGATPPAPPGTAPYFQALPGASSLGSHVTGLSFTAEAGAAVLIRLTCQTDTASDKTTTITLQNIVRFVN